MKGKNIRFLWTSLRVLFRQNRIAFAIYLLLQIVISLGFVFFFTTILTARENYIQKQDSMRIVSVDFASAPSTSQIKEAINQLKARTIAPEYMILIFASPSDTIFTEKPIQYYSIYPPSNEYIVGESITTQSTIEKRKVAIIGSFHNGFFDERNPDSDKYFYYPKNQVGDIITIDGNSFEIIGYNTVYSPDQIEIPYTTGLDCFTLKNISFMLPINLSDNDKENFVDYLSSIFWDAQIDAPAPITQSVLIDLMIPLTVSILIGISAILSFLFLYKFIIESLQKEYCIFRLCGLSTRKLLANIITQLVLLFTLCFAIGTGILSLIRLLFKNSAFFANTALYPHQIFIIYFITLFLLIVFSTPFLIRFCKDIKKGGTKT